MKPIPWSEKWQLYIAVLALVAGSFLGWQQVQISKVQAAISQKQTEIAEIQLKDARTAQEVQYRSDLAHLRKAALKIVDSFSLKGDEAMAKWPLEQRAQWLATTRELLDEEATNPALVSNKVYFDEWLDASQEVEIAQRFLVGDDPELAKEFVSFASRIHTRIFNIAWAAGFVRSTKAPPQELAPPISTEPVPPATK
jgi:hypothetical protein